MKNLNKKRILSVILALAMFCSLGISALAENTYSGNKTLLYFVHSVNERQDIENSALTSTLSTIADIEVFDKNVNYNYDSYDAIAVPFDNASEISSCTIFSSGVLLYLYGALTIGDYKSVTGLSNFNIRKPVCNENGELYGTACQNLENTDTDYQVIGYSSSTGKGLLCGIDGVNISASEYYHAIVENLQKPLAYSFNLFDSGFDFVTYYDSGYASTHLDYCLYKDTGEVDSQADYYAVTTNVWGQSSRGIIKSISSRHSLANANDNIYSHQPSQQSTTNYSVNLNLPTGSSGGTIGISAAFSHKLAISVSANYTTDVVTWSAARAAPYTTSTANIANEVLMTGTSWATGSQNGSIRINLGYTSTRGVASGGAQVIQNWANVPISFSFV